MGERALAGLLYVTSRYIGGSGVKVTFSTATFFWTDHIRAFLQLGRLSMGVSNCTFDVVYASKQWLRTSSPSMHPTTFLSTRNARSVRLLLKIHRQDGFK